MNMEEKKILTCLNKVCGKVFSKPLLALNLQQNSKTTYAACPYCLTKITIIENENNGSQEGTFSDVEHFNGLPSQNKEKIITCYHHIGYISERNQKEQIPDECLLCPEVVQCMHKK